MTNKYAQPFPDNAIFPHTSLISDTNDPLLCYMAAFNISPPLDGYYFFLFKEEEDKRSPMCQFGTHPRLAMSVASLNLAVSDSVP